MADTRVATSRSLSTEYLSAALARVLADYRRAGWTVIQASETEAMLERRRPFTAPKRLTVAISRSGVVRTF
ncbi:hypothetical protein [Desertivibrio insolitus]|uniref:hypothetical protein n=1 Tax=Herbiconiux sp. SYSU D00978 TaxID=2812562 RepID=UPI001A967230|nr:hypothetical protein [Herbiconiux sp. SYSU D00978]